MAAEADKLAELQRAIAEIRDRVVSRYPTGSAPMAVPLADLMPLVHARDAAESKVAAIGTVNPRPPGLINNMAQAWKRFLSRLLDWHVREQVEFNRGMMNCINASIESMNELNRAVHVLSNRTAEEREALERRLFELQESLNALRGEMQGLVHEARELADVRVHWQEWRKEWERKLSINEVQFLRGLADLQAAFNHRATLMEGNFRDISKSQHNDFTGALDRSNIDIQQRLWKDLEKIRLEYERLIYNELRQIRQRAFLSAPAAAVSVAVPAQEDYDVLQFAERFRGTEDRIRTNLDIYLPHFAGCTNVLDIGCGRGEFLEKMRDAGVGARGIDLHEESIALCRSKGLNAEVADMYAFLEAQPDLSFDGIFCSQVVEHLKPAELPKLIALLSRKTARNGVLAIETPNPECLAIFATHFYLDPTHVRPVPPQLLGFYLEEFGFGEIEVIPLSPAIESMPSLASLPADFREQFFGALDYAAVARKL